MTEDKMVGWHHQLNGHEFQQASGAGEGQESLACCRPGGHTELNYKESWMQKNWCFWPVVLEKTLESPLDWKEIQPVNPKGDWSWVFNGMTDAVGETLIFWPSDVKSWLTGEDPDAGKDWGREEKGMTEDEMVGWHHQLNGHEFQQAPGDSEG